ncbi:MAG: DUF4249 domain-containing protein [Bacteroidota bacterium]
MIFIILVTLIYSCEDVVVVSLPNAQNLITVEGWITNFDENQYVRLTRSNSFASNDLVTVITDANVAVESMTGKTYTYKYDSNGFYTSINPFHGEAGTDYRLRIELSNRDTIISKWEYMQEIVPIDTLFVDSFEEDDPENPRQQLTIFFPRISAVDPGGKRNFYRWKFLRDGLVYDEPETITIQDDRFFDGNFIPNNFRSFNYSEKEQIIVQFQSISQEAYDYLNLLKSQITSLGTSSGTTPSFVKGNLSFINPEENQSVLGYFGTVAVSADTAIVE